MMVVDCRCIDYRSIIPLGLFVQKPVFGTLGSQDSEGDTSVIDTLIIDMSICQWSIYQLSIFVDHWDSNNRDTIAIIDDRYIDERFLSIATIVMIDDPFPWSILYTLALLTYAPKRA